MPGAGPGLTYEQIGQALGAWQMHELLVVSRFPECHRLSTPQLEDIYQEATEALLRRRFHSEEHLRNALYAGIKHRARHVYRDERRREEILQESGERLHVLMDAGEQANPERIALIHEDRWIVSEFLAELSEDEREVFGWLAEGMKYRRIAALIGMETNLARNAARSCERKREQFQLLYDTGRLCGYRAATIHALQSGEATSAELAARAFAHLEGCAHCRAEYKTNARRLRRSFQGQAAALLPFPVLLARFGWLSRSIVRARMLHHRLIPEGAPLGSGGVRERAAALVAGGGATAKVIAAGVATVAVVGGTIGASHVLDQAPAQHRHPARAVATPAPSTTAAPPVAATTRAAPGARPHQSGRSSHGGRRPAHAVSRTYNGAASGASVTREPGGFAYLGVPTGSTTAAPSTSAHTASQSGGGPFSP
ncbi:MAG: RNA polymerase sigma factor [Solirubrobacterales bacterium]